jgi:hypothetical protein
MKQFEFVCGGVRGKSPDPLAQSFVLDVQGSNRNVNLRISDITRTMLSTLPDLLLDLLEVAAYVYCADQHATRGDESLAQAGSTWRRAMLFSIPVRLPEVWTSAPVLTALTETLGFLSDDIYDFRFVPAVAPFMESATYFPELSETTAETDLIALFSGGLDSFAGAV